MRLGFIGLGNMGAYMAANLQKQHELVVHDIRREAAKDHLANGAKWAENPAELARQSEIVLTSLPNPPIVEEVSLGANGLIHGMTPGSVYIDLSTNSPRVLKQIAARLEEKGIHMLDAPVSGGSPGAKAGTLAVMVGGDKVVYERCLEIFRLIGKTICHCGPVGSGTQVKLVNNLIAFANLYSTLEGMLLLKKLGLDMKTAFEVIQGSSGDSYVLRKKLPGSVFAGNFEPGFTLDLAYKDVDLGTEMAREANVPMLYATILQQKLLEAKSRGWGLRDWTTIAGPLEETLGVKLRF